MHVHLHLLVDGEDVANRIKTRWQQRYPGRARNEHQDLKRIENPLGTLWYLSKPPLTFINPPAWVRDAVYRGVQRTRFLSTWGIKAETEMPRLHEYDHEELDLYEYRAGLGWIDEGTGELLQ